MQMPFARRLFVLLPYLAVLYAVVIPVQASDDVQYVEMQPAFVVNIGSTGRIAYLKAEVSLRTSKAAAAALSYHMPLLRHEMIMLLSRQTPESLASPEEREALRLKALEMLRLALAQAGPMPESAGTTDVTTSDDIEDLLFTSFITQQ